MPLLATLALIQIQILFAMFVTWTSFTWLGVGAAACVLGCLNISNSVLDPMIDRMFGTQIDRLDFRVEMLMRISIQVGIACAVLYGFQALFPTAFALTWFNFTVPWMVSLVLSGGILGFVSAYSQLLDFPSNLYRYAQFY